MPRRSAFRDIIRSVGVGVVGSCSVQVLRGDAGEKSRSEHYVLRLLVFFLEFLFDKNTRSKHMYLPLGYSKWKSNMPVANNSVLILIC